MTENGSANAIDSRCVTRLALRNYKSVESCEIDLNPLTVLVGRNGAGKSNILDALRFVADALRSTLEYAIRQRGGIDQVRRKSLGGRPTNASIGVRLRLPLGGTALYSFRIAPVQGRGFRVDRELCSVTLPGSKPHAFRIEDARVVDWTPASPAPLAAADRLFLVGASGLPEFRVVYDLLTRMTFHNLNPGVMKFPQRPEPGELLADDGRNLASVVKQLQTAPGDPLARVRDYLQAIGVPVDRIAHKQAGPLETLEVAQPMAVPEGVRNSNFDAMSMSDGTIRAIGILVSLVSARGLAAGGPSLIGIEEPETALHPAAAGALMEALVENADRTQLIITCHSPDLLDHSSVTPAMLLPVLLDNGRTVVGKLAPGKADLLQRHLSSPGELLRLDQLEPDPEDIRRQEEARGTLFEALS